MPRPALVRKASSIVRLVSGFFRFWCWFTEKLRRVVSATPDAWVRLTSLRNETNRYIRQIAFIASLIAIFSLTTWGCVRYGVRPPEVIGKQCESRVGPAGDFGFQGDPDFYGLGIRVGLYLQWVACLIINGFVSEERRGVVTTYTILSLSITIATMIKIYGQQCLFTAEMAVILTLFWGGINIVQIPLIRAHSLTAKSYGDPGASSKWLLWASHLLNFLVSPITIWYWARLASVGEKDFTETPGGTTLFFLGQEQEGGLKRFAIFMAIASCMNFLWLIWTFDPLPFSNGKGRDDTFRVPLNILTFPVVMLYQSVTTLSMMIAAALASICFPWANLKSAIKQLRQDRKSENEHEREEHLSLLIKYVSSRLAVAVKGSEANESIGWSCCCLS